MSQYTNYSHPAALPSNTGYAQHYGQIYSSPPQSAQTAAAVAQLAPISSAPPKQQQQQQQNYRASATPASHAPSSYTPTQNYDSTGQVAPQGVKPRVTATLWEDEGSLCFQVEAKGICVARREDNHFINGTKLLNVAGMTRGRRDGILKSEKTRHVVKIGPMHLKGVWIPFDRALDFANREKITDQLYPLFVHNISALLYNPSQQRPGNAVDNRRRGTEPKPTTTTQSTASSHAAASATPATPQTGTHASQSAARPALDRANTFPTPPASASSNFGSANSYEWTPAVQPQGLSIETGLANARSLPSTPAATPPANSLQAAHSYDASRPVYTSAPQASAQYVTQHNAMARYGPNVQYIKTRTSLGSEGETDPKTEEVNEHEAAEFDPSYGANRAHFTFNATHPGRPQTHWAGGYATPSRPQMNGHVDYTSAYVTPASTGTKSNKRSRDDDDDYGGKAGDEIESIKRRRTGHDARINTVGMPYDQPRSTIIQRTVNR